MKRFLSGALLVATLLGTGCAARIVVPGPPAARVEVIGVAPSPLHVWDPGHWVRAGNGWDWVGGHWIAAPYRGARWVPGRWVRRHGEWFWVDGRWR